MKGNFVRIADLCAERSQGLKRAHTGPIDFVLRALAALTMLQLLKFCCRNAAWKPVIRTICSEGMIAKDPSADEAD